MAQAVVATWLFRLLTYGLKLSVRPGVPAKSIVAHPGSPGGGLAAGRWPCSKARTIA